MPFELRGQCVWQTEPEELIKCHDTPEEARANLAALQANVKDGQENTNVGMGTFMPAARLDINFNGQESIHYQEAALSPIASTDDTPMTGKAWNVTVIGPNSPDDIVTVDNKTYLRSKNKRYYDIAGLEAAVESGVFNDIQVFDNHLTDAEFEQKQGMRSADSELLGAIVSPYWDAKTYSIMGTGKIIKEDLSRKILNAHDADVLNIFGLSVDTSPIMGEDIQIGSEFFPTVSGIASASSVDLVSKPAAGGKFNRVLAAENIKESGKTQRGIETMERAELEKMIGEITLTQMEEREKEQRAKDREEAKIRSEEDEAQKLKDEEDEQARLQKEEETKAEEVITLEEKFQVLESQVLLVNRLNESQLSVASKGIVSQAFTGKIIKADELDTMIKTVQEAQASMDTTGRVTESGNIRETVITAGQNEDDNFTLDFMRFMMGNTAFKALEHNQDEITLERMPEAYNSWRKNKTSLGRTPKMSQWAYQILGGDPMISDRAYEAVTTSSMSSIVKDAVNILIANDYSKREKWWEPIVKTEEVDTIDDATLVRLFGLNTLDVINEGAAYGEMEWSDQEETSSFVKRGGFVGVTLEAMLKDKTNSIRTLPTRLSNSWFNSISLRVAAVFTNNSDTGPVLSDSGALFNATVATTTGGHANLLTAALSFTSWDATYTAMTKQTDRVEGAGAQLGMENAPKFLLVPTDLRATALQIRNSEQLPGSANNDINPHFQGFEVIVVPRWTDTNDWAAVADPNLSAAIWLIFVSGNTVPSIFTADNDSAGAMFTNDQLRWKVRQMTYRFSATYDNAPISDFRGLHKNNVT